MTSLTIFDFNSQIIRFENHDGHIWVSLTDMAKATNKKVNHWLESQSTQEYLKALNADVILNKGSNSDAGIPASEQQQSFPAVLSVNKGGESLKQGTWAIEEVAIDFAQWCSVDFRIWVNRQIKNLIIQNQQSEQKALTKIKEKKRLPRDPKTLPTFDDLRMQLNLFQELIRIERSNLNLVKENLKQQKEISHLEMRCIELAQANKTLVSYKDESAMKKIRSQINKMNQIESETN